MIGIYHDEFIQFLKQNLSESIKIKPTELVVPCPYCNEHVKSTKHNHLYISLEFPVWHCFHASCPKKSGTIKQLIEYLSGTDLSQTYIDDSKIKRQGNIKYVNSKLKEIKYQIPEVTNFFSNKLFYLQKRFNFDPNIDIYNLKGLITDFNSFININHIQLSERELNLKDFIQSNFVGFLSEHHSILMLRNIDDSSKFSHLKIKLKDTNLLDYYKIEGSNKNSNIIVLAEGIYDIYGEFLNNSLNLKDQIKSYYCAFSFSYKSLIKSVVFDEILLNPEIIILSDRNINLNYYKSIKNQLDYIINKLMVTYNKCNKDFGSTPIIPEKFLI